MTGSGLSLDEATTRSAKTFGSSQTLFFPNQLDTPSVSRTPVMSPEEKGMMIVDESDCICNGDSGVRRI